MNLNTEQKLASETSAENLLVLAGPGTGKTTTLVGRYSHLVANGIKPQSILCCTFSRKAADELKARIKKEVKADVDRFPIGTFHSIALRIIAAAGDTINAPARPEIVNETDRRTAMRTIVRKLESEEKFVSVTEWEDKNPRRILECIDRWRDDLVSVDDAFVIASEESDAIALAYAHAYEAYDLWLDNQKKIDFAKMITIGGEVAEADKQNTDGFVNKISHVLIDEYQDINAAQKFLIDQFVSAGANLWVVGDDKQAIYEWRGSSTDFILNYQSLYPGSEVIALKTNYRSLPLIVEKANKISSYFQDNHPTVLEADRTGTGHFKVFRAKNDSYEAIQIAQTIQERIKSGVDYRDIAVLARTNILPHTVADVLIARGIPCVLKDGIKLFAEAIGEELISAVAIASGVPVEKGWDRKLSPGMVSFIDKIKEDKWHPKCKALTTFLLKRFKEDEMTPQKKAARNALLSYRDYLLEFSGPEELFERIRRSLSQPSDGNGVHIGTIHRAKGLEWDSVIVMGLEEDFLPHFLNSSFNRMDEERRLFYVAATRAKDFLFLSYSSERGDQARSPSPYLGEILGKKTVEDVPFNDDTENKAGGSSKNVSDFTEDKTGLEKLMSGLKQRTPEELYTMKRNAMHMLKKGGNTLGAESMIDAIHQELRSRNLDTLPPSDIDIGAPEKDLRDTFGDRITAADRVRAADGLLLAAGYSARKNGPKRQTRQRILQDIFNGRFRIPDDMSDEILTRWGKPGSPERRNKMDASLKMFIATQEGQARPSGQAIQKWGEDLEFIAQELIAEKD